MDARQDAISALAGGLRERAPEVLTAFGSALQSPALTSAGLALAVAPKAKRGTGPGGAKDDLDFINGLDAELAAEDDLNFINDLDAELAAPPEGGPAPAPAIDLPDAAAPVDDPAAPGTFLPTRQLQPLQKLVGVGAGIAQSLADLGVAAMTPDTDKPQGAAKDSIGRLSQAKAATDQAIKDVIAQRNEKSFPTTVSEDMYDLAAALPRLGLSLFEEVPDNEDAFESARKAGYSVVPGMAGQAQALLDDPVGYVRSMPVSTLADVAPLGRGLGIGRGGKVARNIDAAEDALRRDAAGKEALARGGLTAEEAAIAAQDAGAVEEMGKAYFTNRDRPLLSLPAPVARWVSDVGAQATAGYEAVADAFNRPQDFMPRPVVEQADALRRAPDRTAESVARAQDDVIDAVRARRERIQAIQAQYPPKQLVVPPPRLQKVLGSDPLDRGLLDSLAGIEPWMDPSHPLKQIDNVIRANLTAGNPASILNNAASNVLLQAFRRGPTALPGIATRASMHAVAASDLPAATKAKLGVGKLAEYDRVYEILHDLKILDRDALSADVYTTGLNKTMDVISKVGTLGEVMPTLYRAGDRLFKLEESIHNLDKYREYIDLLRTGQFVELRMTPKSVLRVERMPDGSLQGRGYTKRGVPLSPNRVPISTDLPTISPELVRAAAQPALDAFFDYTDIPKFLQAIRGTPALGMLSPFAIWSYKAMDLPGKRGLGFESLAAPGGVTRTNSYAIKKAEFNTAVSTAAGRAVVLEAAHRQLLQDPLAPESQQLAQSMAYRPKEPRTALIRAITDPANKDAGTNYIYAVQAGNWNFLAPTDKIARIATWGTTNIFAGGPEGLRDTMRELRNPDLPVKERLEGQRKLELMMRVYSGRVSDYADVASVLGFAGGPLLDGYEKLMQDEQSGKDVTTSELAAVVGKMSGIPQLALRAYANANPDSDYGEAFRDRSRDLVVPDPNLRETLGRVMIRRMLGAAWKTLPLGDAQTPNGKVYGTIDNYFFKLGKELEASTGTSTKEIERLNAEANELYGKGDLEGGNAKKLKADARAEVRTLLFGVPANPKAGIPAVEGELAKAKRDLYSVLDRTRPPAGGPPSK